mgnify:FL=1
MGNLEISLTAIILKLPKQDDSTSPSTLTQEHRLRIIKAPDYFSALESLVKEEIHTSDTLNLSRLDYNRQVADKMTEYNNHLILHTTFKLSFRDLFRWSSFIVKKDGIKD